MNPTRRAVVSPLLVLALAALAFAPPALADEPPSYGAADLVLEEEGVESPWEMVYDELPGTPGYAIEDWVMGVAKSAGIDEMDVLCETRILQGPEDAAATLLVAEVDAEAGTFLSTLEARGKAEGYVVRPLAHPSRVLVVAAPPDAREPIVDMQLAYAVRSLTDQGWDRLQQNSLVGAETFAKAARELNPKAGAPMVLLGMVATKKELYDEAIEAFRVGFGKGVSVPAKGRLAMRGYAHYGYACLEKKGDYFREGREAFQRCVELEGEGDPKKDPLYIQRYNLACAHARLGETDEALTQLEMAFEMRKKSGGVPALTNFVQRHVLQDEDLASLKDHPGFKAIVERALAGGGSGIPDGSM